MRIVSSFPLVGPALLGAFLIGGGIGPAFAQACSSYTAAVCIVNGNVDWSGTDWSERPSVHVGAGIGGQNAVSVLSVGAGANLYAPNAIQLGNAPGSDATLDVFGSGTLVHSGRMGVGAQNTNATGRLRVRDNAVVQIDGPFNSAFYQNNVGFIDILSGGRIETTGDALLGRAGTATATVDGAGGGAFLDIGAILHVGRMATGNGTLNIVNGGFVSTAATSLGIGGTASATVRGTGSRLVAEGELRIGGSLPSGTESGTGSLAILDHGAVSAGFVSFGIGTGVLELDTDGTLETGHIVGNGGTGTVGFNGGTLRLTADQPALFDGFGAGGVTLRAGGGIFDTQGHDIGVAGGIGGVGALTKRGTGTLRFETPQSYAGATFLEEGTLAAGTANAFAPGSNHVVRAGTTLHTGDFNQTVQALDNSGRVSLSGGTPGDLLTVTGNYRSDGGIVELDSVLGGDGSPTDRLAIQGDSQGSTGLRVNNAGGQRRPNE